MFIKEMIIAQFITNVFYMLNLFAVFASVINCDANGMLGIGTLSCSDFMVTGKALVVANGKEICRIADGDIIIAHQIDSMWDSALTSSAGIITEKGGDNNYALSLGKRLNIPVIVGVTGATKNITDGSWITMDCSTKSVYYALRNSNNIFPQNDHNINDHNVNARTTGVVSLPKKYVYKIKSDYILHHTNDENKMLSRTTEDIKRSKTTNSILEKLQNDTTAIKKYITDKVAKDIRKAGQFGKTAAYWFGGISHYAFDSIPFEFFRNPKEIENAFQRLEEGVDYIYASKEDFKKNIKNGSKIDDSALAKFLYNRIVDKITVKDDERKLLREEPIKMDEFVRRGIVPREEYMYYTLLNFVARYYLEEELNKR